MRLRAGSGDAEGDRHKKATPSQFYVRRRGFFVSSGRSLDLWYAHVGEDESSWLFPNIINVNWLKATAFNALDDNTHAFSNMDAPGSLYFFEKHFS